MNPDAQRGRLTDAPPQSPSPTMRHTHSSDRHGGTLLMGIQMSQSLITDTSWVGGTMDDVTIMNSRFLGSSLDLGISGSLHVADNKFELRNNPNVTKAAQFDCSGITASATRIFTFPDSNGTLVVLALAQTLQNKNLDATNTVAAAAITGLGTWATWTPTLTQGAANATLSVTEARYCQLGKLVIAKCRVQVLSAGSAGDEIAFGGLPVAARTLVGDTVIGYGHYIDTGTANYEGTLVANDLNSGKLYVHGSSSSLGQSPNFAFASGDVFSLTFEYEVA